MPSSPDGESERREESPPPQTDAGKAEDEKASSRRRFLEISLTLGLVLVLGGVASIARSLISPPSAAPSPPPPETRTATQTVTSTETQVLTGGTSAGSSSTSSTSESSSSTSSSSSAASPFPRILVANISDLSVGPPAQTVTFNYPLEETPNILAKLGQKAEGGVGPDGDIVAFSQLCQHLGCVFGYVGTGTSPKCDNAYKATGPVGYCCCHGSVYDLASGGTLLEGPSPRPQPQVILEFDSSTGDIYAIGMGPPTIFGHDTGSNDVLNDLVGGTPVS